MSDDLDSEQRPNKNYALSKQEGVVYHYNRERRLENAPKEVQDLYKGNKQMKFSLFGPLLADKPRRTLFIIIIVLCVGILVLSRMGYFDTTFMLDENKIEITGTTFEGTTIIILKKTASNQNAFTGAVDIVVSPIIRDDDGQFAVFAHRIFFSLDKEEVYRFAAPFDDDELLMVLQSDKSTLQIKFKPD